MHVIPYLEKQSEILKRKPYSPWIKVFQIFSLKKKIMNNVSRHRYIKKQIFNLMISSQEKELWKQVSN